MVVNSTAGFVLWLTFGLVALIVGALTIARSARGAQQVRIGHTLASAQSEELRHRERHNGRTPDILSR